MNQPVPANADDLVIANGIEIETGQYALAPRPVDEIARQLVIAPVPAALDQMDVLFPPTFGIRFGVDPLRLEQSGWGLVFHTDTPAEIRDALQPLVDRRTAQVGELFKVLDYLPGEQMRGWYDRHGLAEGNVDPEVVPYYLMLVGQPDLIPFEFQYLVGIEYAVGRLAFDAPEEYERYARSVLEYETSGSVPNAREIAYWGTRHSGDAATELSATQLIVPLASGLAGAAGAVKRPVHEDVGFQRRLMVGEDAKKDALLGLMHARPPAMVFTASHGSVVTSSAPDQAAKQGALVCQDWSGFGGVRDDQLLSAVDIDDAANVNGLIAFMFACYSAGTPSIDQFVKDLDHPDRAMRIAPSPFVSGLAKRLLGHPNGSALALLGHVDRAWGCSIRANTVPVAQIGTFRNAIGQVLSGTPVGHAMSATFGQRFSVLSTALGSATSPTAPQGAHLTDRELVLHWIERNDAQNYVVLGDPAVRVRTDDL
jgi:hypothetical protein